MKVGQALILLLLLFSCKKEFPDAQAMILGHGGESIHKSKSKYSPNTLKSVERAIEQGADGVEIDVQMTSDGELVAYHDYNLAVNSDGSGCIPSKTYAEISDLTIYNSKDHIEKLEGILDYCIDNNKRIMLDVKHNNECAGAPIDYAMFNASLTALMVDYPPVKRILIMVNCRDIALFNYVVDGSIHRSLESDDLDYAMPQLKSHLMTMMTVKLDMVTEAMQDSLDAYNMFLSIYNVKTRKELNDALTIDPDFVISDNIKCAVKATDG